MILMEIDPTQQKTLPDFLLTEKLLGIRTVDITAIQKAGNALYWEDAGKRVPIRRIYNRAIVDELERKGAKLGFDFRDDLTWSGRAIPTGIFDFLHSLPQATLRSRKRGSSISCPRFLADLENYALKPPVFVCRARCGDRAEEGVTSRQCRWNRRTQYHSARAPAL